MVHSLFPEFSDNFLLLPRARIQERLIDFEKEKVHHNRIGPLATTVTFQLTYRPRSFFFFFFFCFGVGERELLDSRTRLGNGEKNQEWVLREIFSNISTSEEQNLKNLGRTQSTPTT